MMKPERSSRATRAEIQRRLDAAERAGNWRKTLAAAKEGLSVFPNDHWLAAKMGEALLEGREPERALSEYRRAERLKPSCPLVLWGLAGTLDALGQREEAARLYRRLTNRGPTRIAHGECGEGLSWSRGLVADAYYRRGLIAESQGDPELSLNMYRRYLATVGPGVTSIYSPVVIKNRLRNLTAGFPMLNRRRRTAVS